MGRRTEAEILSNFPVRGLGWGADGEFMLTEEERESHIHILGAPGEGKSKLIELLVRQDISAGYGACVLDPSENGDTVNKILKYCYSIGFDKVCLINPVDFLEYKRVPIFNPIKHNAPARISVGNVMDSLQVLWQQKSFSDTPRIQKYATALLHALHASGMTLVESKYFLARNSFISQREKILSSTLPDSLHHATLKSAYQTIHTFEQFQSTVNRFGVFQDEILRLVLGSKSEGIPFADLIANGWVILVNLDPQSVWGIEQIQQRLLGTLIINEITHAIHRLNSRGWKGAYYLYIDEVGDYATSKLAYILDKKRKTGLRFTLAHQRFDQIEDRNVLSAVRGSAKIKILFFTKNQQDRLLMMKDMGYGGELSDRHISYELGQTEKQTAAVSINKRPPRLMRVQDTEDTKVAEPALKKFKTYLYDYHWYLTPEEINQEISERFPLNLNPAQQSDGYTRRTPRKDSLPIGKAKTFDSQTDSPNRQRRAKRKGVKTFLSEG